ncbi:LexA family transcriptional regulator [Aliivibrio finisterrensis]|uniref:LexA family transcriptional regulator n=1 Tax=Aliivibrio finisterrensis TaxID=511998 RepID=A0A4V1Z864_9GAMM|nr:XRE family transcriptional regulator [Aliivibrio finisterrensis]RYU47887.1 LexA family transcriptional regulator [Aliivibrio finisterrensis]
MKSVTYDNNPTNTNNNEKGIILANQIIPFKDRLKEAIGDTSLRSFAKDCDLSPSTVSNYLSGTTYPTLDRLAIMAEVSNASYSWLATGELVNPSYKMKNSIEVYQYDFSASAGPGCLVVSEDPVAKFELSKEWLIRQGLSGKKLAVVPVCGDSMEPTLIDEDLMLVVLIDDHKEARDGVCVIRIDDEVMVKRIQYDFMERGYHVKSDNDSYQSFFVGPEYQDRFSIIGRMARVLQRAKR